MSAKLCKYTYFYIHDHLGFTSMVLDADGNISQSVTYIPYGEIFVEERNGAWNSPYLFNSKELDEETGLYYYGARYLNPTSGMWLSVDPLWEKNIDASPYSYCHGNPVMKVDVMGLDDSFYCEDGSKIGSVKSETNNYYVVRTTQTTDEMYAESSIDQKGNSNPISQSDALRAKLIANSACSGDGVFSKEEIPMHLFVQIPNQEEADASFAFIGDDGTGGMKPENNKEYGWNIDRGNCSVTSTTESEFAGDPSKNSAIGVQPRLNHTHPSGTNGSYMWQQPPSKTDILNHKFSSQKNVWGMRSQKLYIYNNSGVIAVVPFSIYKK